MKARNLDENSKENEEKEKRAVEQWDIKIQSMFFNLVCSCFYLISFGLFCFAAVTMNWHTGQHARSLRIFGYREVSISRK